MAGVNPTAVLSLRASRVPMSHGCRTACASDAVVHSMWGATGTQIDGGEPSSVAFTPLPFSLTSRSARTRGPMAGVNPTAVLSLRASQISCGRQEFGCPVDAAMDAVKSSDVPWMPRDAAHSNRSPPSPTRRCDSASSATSSRRDQTRQALRSNTELTRNRDDQERRASIGCRGPVTFQLPTTSTSQWPPPGLPGR